MKYFLILTMAVLATGANIFLKIGMQSVNGTYMRQNWLTRIQLFSNIYVLLALVLYVICALFWMRILSMVDLSYGFPVVVTLTICFVTIVSWLIFKEQISAIRVLGIFVLCIGIILVLKS
jgi:multidrug transporter EmrE-like cation transporter